MFRFQLANLGKIPKTHDILVQKTLIKSSTIDVKRQSGVSLRKIVIYWLLDECMFSVFI